MTNHLNNSESRHVVGVFDSEQAVISAIEDLKALGYSSDQISVVSKNKKELKDIHEETGTKAPQGIATGAATGGVIGGVTGLLAGLGLLAVPGIGPLLAAGPIAATLSGAAVGAGAGGLVGGLIGLGIPKEEAERYNEYVNDHKLLVIVDADMSRQSRVYDIFRRYGSLNADTYANLDGESRDDLVSAASGPSTSSAADVKDAKDLKEADTLRLHEERLNVDKERVRTGEVSVHKDVIEERQTIEVPVQREEVVIERHAVQGETTDGAAIGKDETIRIPVSEERVEVTKRPVATEEISIGKRVVQDTEHVSETVRKERAELDRSGHPAVENEDLFSTPNTRR
ncbi:YsnF/AvaK domain-containing protein [Cohnella ginsengisoli]|uniref:YsnF/AvaK domain-containing protein n=1 Tax=Cohnella ginsengisoli TaxID=425004 RepID=A0A9X4KGA7_9BACL|nr:YsnF/AvaK domain-containing protein [Cohnella ginsengisoli]MDG0791428.1 YsnF/AvaK domain-containing protein [Cohnella ginsengisoli]